MHIISICLHIRRHTSIGIWFCLSGSYVKYLVFGDKSLLIPTYGSTEQAGVKRAAEYTTKLRSENQ